MIANSADRVQALVFRIFQLDDLLRTAADRIALPAAQTGARWQVLNALDDGPNTVAAVARLKNATRQGVQRIVNELAAEGVVELKPNPRHRRFPLVEMTERGRTALLRIRKDRQTWASAVVANLDGDIDESVLLFLDRFRSAVAKTLQESAAS